MTVINSNRAVRGPVTAIPLVAGKGVKITADTVNNRYVAEVDETVLWESGTSATSGSFSESPANFEYLKVYCNRTGSNSANNLPGYTEVLTRDGIPTSFVVVNGVFGGADDIFMPVCVFNLSSSGFSLVKGRNIKLGSSAVSVDVASFTGVGILKVVGVNRIASN